MYSPYAKVINPSQPRASRYVYRGRAGKQRRAAYTAKARTLTQLRGTVRTGGYYGRYNQTPRREEKKFLDTFFPEAPIDGTGEQLLTSLNLIPQGTTQSQRVGRKCTVTNISIKGQIVWGAKTMANLPTQYIRFALVLDTQCNGANITYADVYTGDGVFSFRNLANSQRFQVLKEWRITPSNVSVSTSDNWATLVNTVVQPVNYKIKYNKTCSIPLEFSSTTGAITEIRSNNLCFVAESNNADDTDFFDGVVRIRFTG